MDDSNKIEEAMNKLFNSLEFDGEVHELVDDALVPTGKMLKIKDGSVILIGANSP